MLAHVHLGPFLGENDQGIGTFDGNAPGMGGERKANPAAMMATRE